MKCKWNIACQSLSMTLLNILSYLLGYRRVVKDASRAILAVALRIEIQHLAGIVELPSKFSV